MTLDEALSLRVPRVGVWEGDTLAIVALERASARLLVRQMFAAEERPALEQRLVENGVVIGATHRACDFVWVFDDEHCSVVQLDVGITAEAIGRDFVIGGRRCRISDIVHVISFVDRGDIAHRGVKLRLADGSEPVVAEERDPAPSIDPTYGRQNLEIDAGWIVILGRELAANLGVPHHDELWDRVTPAPPRPRRTSSTDAVLDGLIEAYLRWDEPARVAKREALAAAKARRDQVILDLAYIESGQRGDVPMDVAVAKMAEHFAGRIERETADLGPFAPIHQPLPEIENGGYIALDLKGRDDGTRALELHVESPSGERMAHELLREGTSSEIVRFLRSPALPEELLPLMERLTDATRDR